MEEKYGEEQTKSMNKEEKNHAMNTYHHQHDIARHGTVDSFDLGRKHCFCYFVVWVGKWKFDFEAWSSNGSFLS